jgi:hypothetical protein
MAEFELWLEVTGSQPIKLIIGSDTPISLVKSRIIDRLGLPSIGRDGNLDPYRLVNMRTGQILVNDSSPIQYGVKNGDHLILQSVSAGQALENANKAEKKEALVTAHPANTGSGLNPIFDPLALTFSIAGTPLDQFDFNSEYPVLAVNFKYSTTGYGIPVNLLRKCGIRTEEGLSGRRLVYAKESFFLISKKDGEFLWVSPAKSSLFVPGLQKEFPAQQKNLTRYSANKDIGEIKNMIYPVRPFSITGINMEAFRPDQGYPVLAIDMDQFIPETRESEEEESPEEQAQSMAFFLVGDDNGEFAWIAEDECRLFPLKPAA